LFEIFTFGVRQPGCRFFFLVQLRVIR
jgi:hypothetical protein